MPDPATTPTMPPAPVILIPAVAIGMSGGMAILFMTTLGVFMKPIIAELGWSRSEVSMLLTASFLGYATGSPVLGALLDRFGARRVLAGGIVSLVAGLCTMSLVQLGPLSTALLALAIGFTGSATAPSGYVQILTLSVDRRLGTMLGMAMLGQGVGVTLAPMLAQSLIESLGWRGAYLALAALAGLLGSVALLLGVGRGVEGARDRRAPAEIQTGMGPDVKGAMADYRFWIIGLTATMLAVAGFGMTGHIVAILSDKGISDVVAAQIAGAMGAGVFLGRIGAAVLMDRIFAPYVAAACTMLGAVGLFLVSSLGTDQVPGLFAAAVLVGLLTGSEGDTMPILVRRYFGTHAFGTIYGAIIGLAGLGGIVGPYAYGMTFDRTGSYSLILYACIGLCGLSTALFLALDRYRFPAERAC